MSAADRIKAESKARLGAVKKIERLRDELCAQFDQHWIPGEGGSDPAPDLTEVFELLLARVEHAPLKEPAAG